MSPGREASAPSGMHTPDTYTGGSHSCCRNARSWPMMSTMFMGRATVRYACSRTTAMSSASKSRRADADAAAEDVGACDASCRRSTRPASDTCTVCCESHSHRRAPQHWHTHRLHAVSEQEAVIQRVQLLALGELVGGPHQAQQGHRNALGAVVEQALIQDGEQRVQHRAVGLEHLGACDERRSVARGAHQWMQWMDEAPHR